MVYDVLTNSDPIRQGDIFCLLPLATVIDPGELNLIDVSKEGAFESYSANWSDIAAATDDNFLGVVSIQPAWGIVATQNCDAIRSQEITFFRIDEFMKITGLTLGAKLSGRVSNFTIKARANASWYYLPPDSSLIGFSDPMAASFLEPFRVRRIYLEKHGLANRRGRLKKVAYEHYRECIAQFFRRYPYDEWYPLNKDEFSLYNQERGNAIKPFPWQK